MWQGAAGARTTNAHCFMFCRATRSAAVAWAIVCVAGYFGHSSMASLKSSATTPRSHSPRGVL